MDRKEHFLNDIWPLLSDEQKVQILDIAETLARFAPVR